MGTIRSASPTRSCREHLITSPGNLALTIEERGIAAKQTCHLVVPKMFFWLVHSDLDPWGPI